MKTRQNPILPKRMRASVTTTLLSKAETMRSQLRVLVAELAEGGCFLMCGG
jgi:hypothetical protein